MSPNRTQPATWVWLALSLLAVGLCVVGTGFFSDWSGELGPWLTLGACLVVGRVFLGWLVELLTIGLTGRLGDALHWQEPVLIVAVGGMGLWLQFGGRGRLVGWLVGRQEPGDEPPPAW
jgi:hypothetical protein